MEGLSIWNTGIFTNTITFILIIFCFYYTLSFFQHLKGGDEKVIKKSKRAAVICLAIALALPALTNMYYLFLMTFNR